MGENYFRPGASWPPAKIAARNAAYDRRRKLFQSQHENLFSTLKLPEEIRYISVPFPRLVTKIHRDMLFRSNIQYVPGDEPQETQEAILRIIKETRLNRTLREAALTGTYFGDSYLRAGKDFHGKAKTSFGVSIDTVDPTIIIPRISDKDKSVAESLIVSWITEIDTEGQTNPAEKTRYLYAETHSEGQIVLQKFLLKEGGMIDREVDLDPEDGEGVILFPVPDLWTIHHIPNESDGLCYYGLSAFEGIEDLIREMNNRVSRIARILDVFSSPKMKLPVSAATHDDSGNLIFNVNEVIPITDDQNADSVGYLTWEARLESCENQIDWLKQFAFLGSDTSEAAFGSGLDANASGISVWLRMSRTLMAAENKAEYWKDAIAQVLYAAQVLEVEESGANYDPIIPNINIETGLPMDRETAIRIAKELKANGFATEAMALMVAHPGITPESVAGMLEEIRAEKTANAPQSARAQFQARIQERQQLAQQAKEQQTQEPTLNGVNGNA